MIEDNYGDNSREFIQSGMAAMIGGARNKGYDIAEVTAYESGFAAGRAKGVEESKAAVFGKRMTGPSPFGALHGVGWNSAVGECFNAVNGLITTRDAEKGDK